MASTSSSGREKCKHNARGKVCKCQEWDPSSLDKFKCDYCKHHMSFHEPGHPVQFGRCLEEFGEGALHEDGCQEFFPSDANLKLCAGCSHHRSIHYKVEAVGDHASPSSGDCGQISTEPSSKRLKFDVPCVDGSNSYTATSDQVLEPKHKVFLNHSGSQKDFVEQLCVDMERKDRHPFFDKRQHSLPVGEKFPKLIFDAIRQCHVFVAILSNEYFTKTKWPMLELVAMMKEQERNRIIKIIPVYLGISRDECCDPLKHDEWLSIWSDWAESDRRINIQDWMATLQKLKSINDLMMEDEMGAVKFRRKIVEAVCKLIPPETKWDDLHVQGRLRLCKTIIDKIDLKPNKPRDGVRVVGLYGMGGIGKSTICKALCNELCNDFHGRVCHVELKSGSDSVELLREVLRNLTDTSHEILGRLNIDKCHNHLKKHIVKQQVFLAIDNVSDDLESIKQAKTLLSAGFQNGSVVMVTARSLNLLKGLNIPEDDCLEMPKLGVGEARALFLNHVASNLDMRKKMDKELITSCLDRCRFLKSDRQTYHYHPLALEVLGEQLGYHGYDPRKWKDELSKFDTFNESRTKEHPIFSILRSSFDSLAQEDQLLFVDVALFVPEIYYQPEMWNLFQWLGMVHGSNADELMRRLKGLKRKSLLENLGDGMNKIGVHDLWLEFCIAESNVGKFRDRRWLYVGSKYYQELGESTPSGQCWENLERICFSNKGWLGLNGVSTQYFSNVTVLKLVSEFSPSDLVLDLDLKGLKHLKSLDMKTHKQWIVKVVGLGMLKSLVFLRWKEMPDCVLSVKEIGGLTKLQDMELEGFKGDTLPDIGKLTSLRTACFWKSDKIKIIAGLGNLVDLEQLHVPHCPKLEKLPHLEKLTKLKILDVSFCKSVRALPDLSDSVSLEELSLSNCPLMTALPNLRGKLRKLNINRCTALTALPGLSDLVCLEELHAFRCIKLKTLCDTSKLNKLRTLDIAECPMQALPGFDGLIGLQQLWASFNKLRQWPHLHKLTSLRSMNIEGWSGPGLASVANLAMLENLVILGCPGVDVLPDLQNLTQLQRLRLRRRGFKDLSGLSNLSKLQSLHVGDCSKLDSFPDMERLTSLKSLTILKCKRDSTQYWPIVSKLRSLKTLEVEGAGNYNMQIKLPDVDLLTSLRSLTLVRGGYGDLLSIGSLSQLEILKCKDLPKLVKVPDISVFPRLHTLWYINCAALMVLACGRSLTALKVIHLHGCMSLQEVPDLSNFPQVEELSLHQCQGLMSLTASVPLRALKKLDVARCQGLTALSDSLCSSVSVRNSEHAVETTLDQDLSDHTDDLDGSMGSGDDDNWEPDADEEADPEWYKDWMYKLT